MYSSIVKFLYFIKVFILNVISKTPFRISFFGGGTDYPEFFKKNEGEVLSTTIDKYCYISCRYLPPFFEHNYRIVYSKIEEIKKIKDINHPSVKSVLEYYKVLKGVEIHHDGDLPARSGLGSSSSFTVGLINTINALNNKIISKQDLANIAIKIEQKIIKENVGSQDQVAVSFGGFNHIRFSKDSSINVNPLILPNSRLKKLNENLMLFFTGISRFSNDIAKSKIENFKNKERELFKMKDMVLESMRILNSNEKMDLFGKLLHESWLYKRSLSKKVSTPFIDEIYEKSLENGALGGKILGAGGGGFLLLFVPKHFQEKIKIVLKNLVYVPFKFENSGSQIVLYKPHGY